MGVVEGEILESFLHLFSIVSHFGALMFHEVHRIVQSLIPGVIFMRVKNELLVPCF